MEGPLLKRKSQHELSDLHSKEKKTLTEFDDMIDDVIEMILYCLELKDLANVSDTSRRLRKIAGSVFSRKYRDDLISINASEPDNRAMIMKIDPNFISCKKPVISIFDANIWFKILRNFGKSIRFIRVISEQEVERRELKIVSSWKNVTKYVLKYCCTDSLEVLEFKWYHFFLNKSLVNLQEFFGHISLPHEALKLMPNIRTLKLINVPKSLETHFPHLEKVSLRLKGTEDVQLFCSFLHMNPQLKKLILYLLLKDRNELIYSTIIENLPNLEVFKVSTSYHTKTRANPIQIHRFNTIDKFSLTGFPVTVWREVDSFEFNDLKKLSLLAGARNNDYTNFIVRNKKLKILKTRLTCIIDYRRLVSELHELDKIIIDYKLHEKRNLFSTIARGLGKEWEQQHEETCPSHRCMWPDGRWRCVFQRIQK